MAEVVRATMVVMALALVAGCATLPPSVAIGRIEQPGNTQVPLPPGNWVRLADDVATTGHVLGGGIDNSHTATSYYARVEEGRVKQLVYVRTSEGAPHAHGYGTGGDCLRDTPSDYRYYRDVRGGVPNAIDCMQVVGTRPFGRPNQASSPVYRSAYEAAQAYGGLPRQAVMVEIAEAQSQRFQAYYLFDFPPQTTGTESASAWRSDDLTPDRRTYVDGLIAWGKGFRDAVRLGTEHRL